MALGRAPATVRVDVLGPLRLTVGGETVEVRGPKRRAILALLALAEGRTVPVNALLDALWPTEVPESGRQALHSHVSRLRGHLGPASPRLENRPDGYRLLLGEDGLDLARARTLLARARGLAGHDPAGASALLREARALWRGPVLADLGDVLPIAGVVEECAQLHREVTDALISSAIAAGEAEQVVGLAVATLSADPLREPSVLLLMRALAATGRAPEALRAAREYRHRLAEETGLDPSAELDQLEREVAGGAAGPAPGAARVLPRPATRLIGRETDVAAVHRRLQEERLVTLVGPGGVGKTRVAVEVARRAEATAVLLLAPITDPAGVPHALASALGLEVVRGDVLTACLAVLGDRPGLLVIDNCEHLLDAARAVVEALLSACPRLAVLATSREPLGLTAECLVRLPPLRLPDGERELARVPSVALFLDRAGRVRPGLPPTPEDLRTIADIVRRLDGIPLAIELAAGRLSAFSLADLRSRLARSLDLLGGGSGGDVRHRTLRATVEWSYRLLAEDERRLFRHMSVFVDGMDLDDAERLAAHLTPGTDPGGVLARLVDASMLEVGFDGGTRYRMLETLRTFGLDRLAAAGETEAATERLQRWAVELTSWVAATLPTEREPEADASLRRELANLRAAWRSARSRGAVDEAAAMVTALFEAVAYRDLLEIRDWAEELAGDPTLDGRPLAAAVLGTAAEAAYHRGDHSTAERLARAGLERGGDDGGPWYCLYPLSVVALARGAHAECVEYCLAAAACGPGPRDSLGIAALALAYSGDTDAARTLNDRGLAGAVSPSMRSWGAYVTGEIETCAGRRDRAEEHYVRAIELARTSGATFLVGVASVGLLAARAAAGRVTEALVGYREVIDYFARTGNWTHQWTTLRNLADLLRRLGDDQPAEALDAAADAAGDAPAHADRAPPPATVTAAVDRDAVLAVARGAIEHNLSRW
ncbi:MAG TPA: BTAD domain-containing putative transcriptional regulator [Geodermatophilus sp.]|nr:BTAD domain-containing putative transcriptional regulator [Geodermatophilus sp.]